MPESKHFLLFMSSPNLGHVNPLVDKLDRPFHFSFHCGLKQQFSSNSASQLWPFLVHFSYLYCRSAIIFVDSNMSLPGPKAMHIWVLIESDCQCLEKKMRKPSVASAVLNIAGQSSVLTFGTVGVGRDIAKIGRGKGCYKRRLAGQVFGIHLLKLWWEFSYRSQCLPFPSSSWQHLCCLQIWSGLCCSWSWGEQRTWGGTQMMLRSSTLTSLKFQSARQLCCRNSAEPC